METRNLGILAGIIVVITIIGTITLSGNFLETVDKLAVDYDTIDVLLKNNEHVFVVDIRSAEQYQKGHIIGASHDNFTDEILEKRANTILNRLPNIAATHNIVLIDDDGTDAKNAAQIMNDLGIQTFYLNGGMKNLNEDLKSSSQTVIDSQELSQRLTTNDDIFLLDVREPDELLQSKIAGSVNIPLAEIFEQDKINEIPTDKPVVIICGSGNRATIATYALAQEDIDFQVLEGGIKAWNSFQKTES